MCKEMFSPDAAFIVGSQLTESFKLPGYTVYLLNELCYILGPTAFAVFTQVSLWWHKVCCCKLVCNTFFPYWKSLDVGIEIPLTGI